MTSEPAGGVLERSPSSELADVVEMVLDKGVVIDAQISVAVVGIRLLEINARITIASIETYLRFAEAVDRLDINPEQEQGLAEVVGGLTAGVTGAVGDVGRTARKTIDEVGGDVVGEPADRRNPDRAARRRRTEES